MDFAFDALTEDLIGRLTEFMDTCVYPAEPVFAEQVSAAAERRTSASANALRPLRYRDVGLAACISYGREEPPPGGCTPASSQDGRGSPTGSLTGCQRPPSSSRTQPHRAS